MLVSKGVKLTVITRKMDLAAAELECVGNVLVKRISPQSLLKGKGWRALGPLLLSDKPSQPVRADTIKVRAEE